MPVDTAELRKLSPEEKLQLVELLWDDLGAEDVSIPLPDWVTREAVRRRDELKQSPESGIAYDDMLRRIEQIRG